jgi:hypothetical protein
VGSKILIESEQEFLLKFEREAKSNKYQHVAKSYQNSYGKQHPIKIRARSRIKIGAGSKTLSKIKWEAKFSQNRSRNSYLNSCGEQNPINTNGD